MQLPDAFNSLLTILGFLAGIMALKWTLNRLPPGREQAVFSVVSILALLFVCIVIAQVKDILLPPPQPTQPTINGGVASPLPTPTLVPTVIAFDEPELDETRTITITESFSRFAASKDGQILGFSTYNPPGIWLRKGRNNQQQLLPSSAVTVTAMVMSEDGRWLVVTTDDWSMVVWDLSDPTAEPFRQRFNTQPTSLAISKQIDAIAVGFVSSTVLTWNISNDQLSASQMTEQSCNHTKSIAFSPDRSLVAIGCEDKQVAVWNITMNTVTRHSMHDYPLGAVAFVPGGQSLASGDLGGNIKMLDLKTGQTSPFFTEQNKHGIVQLAFSSDGKLLASSVDDNNVLLWDLKHKMQGLPLHGHNSLVWHLVFTEDSKTLITAAPDQGTIKFWLFP